MNHPRRNWRKRWTWDPETATAIHESGIAVAFAPSGRGGWNGQLVAGTTVHLDSADPRRVARIMREAGDYAAEHLNRNA